jgi:hypothetical protein
MRGFAIALVPAVATLAVGCTHRDRVSPTKPQQEPRRSVSGSQTGFGLNGNRIAWVGTRVVVADLGSGRRVDVGPGAAAHLRRSRYRGRPCSGSTMRAALARRTRFSWPRPAGRPGDWPGGFRRPNRLWGSSSVASPGRETHLSSGSTSCLVTQTRVTRGRVDDGSAAAGRSSSRLDHSASIASFRRARRSLRARGRSRLPFSASEVSTPGMRRSSSRICWMAAAGRSADQPRSSRSGLTAFTSRP